MKVTYDAVITPKIYMGYKYGEEKMVILEFIDSTHTNVVLEYDSNKEARRVAVALERYIRAQNLPVKVRQRGNNIFIIRREVKKND